MASFSPPSHDFRYESELCSMAEGQTLTQWRRRERAGAEGVATRRGPRAVVGAAVRRARRRRLLTA